MSRFDEIAPLPREVVMKRLNQHPLWACEGDKLIRTFRAKNFKSALDFIASVGAIAEKYHHHPDISISESKKVEIRVYHHPLEGVTGVTEDDFKMVERYDNLPVNYSIYWRKQNEDLFDTATTSAPEWEAPATPTTKARREDSMRGHPDRASFQQRHRQNDLVMSSRADSSHSDSIHSSHDAAGLHSHSFKVNTGHHSELGRGDGAYNISHTHTFNDSNHIRINPAGAAPEELQAGFGMMVDGLRVLDGQGNDSSICDTFLPMLENNKIVPGYSDDLKKAHAHIKHRATDWAKDEPTTIVDASYKFCQGYEVIAKVYENLNEV